MAVKSESDSGCFLVFPPVGQTVPNMGPKHGSFWMILISSCHSGCLPLDPGHLSPALERAGSRGLTLAHRGMADHEKPRNMWNSKAPAQLLAGGFRLKFFNIFQHFE